jgi:exonuclease SbcD
VAGGEPCESERALTVGGSAEVGIGVFDGFDYVALGHLHGRQSFAGGRVRYSGSPVAYSFSERAHVKGAWMVDIAPDGAVSVESVDLPVPRPLAVIRGTLADLLESAEHTAAEHAWVQAVLTEPVLPPEAMSRLRRRFPHALCLAHEPAPIAAGSRVATYTERVRNRSDLDLALDFVEHVTGLAASNEEQADLEAALTAAGATGSPGEAA